MDMCNQRYHFILEMLNDCSIIKYTAYRTAAKLRVLQRALQVDCIRLGVIAGVFHRHRLKGTENEVTLENVELEAVLSDIFEAARREATSQIDINMMTKLTLKVLLEIYDKEKTSTMQVISAKVALVVLCSSRIQEKYLYLFHQLADHNNCVPRKKFELLLKQFVKLTEFLSESVSFGAGLIPATVESCFQQVNGNLGLTEDAFIGWLLCEPQLLVWLSTLYRMQSADLVCHLVRCDVCKVYPVTGLRYRCLHCFNYNQCQTCFFTGKLSKRHKLKHPIQEYCCQVTPKEATVAFLKMVRNKLRKNSSKYLHYLPADPNTFSEESRRTVDSKSEFYKTSSINGDCERLLDDIELSAQTVVQGSRVPMSFFPQKELQSIISHLEEENRHLEELCAVEGPRLGAVTYLTDHKAQMEAQVERLKILKSYLLNCHSTPFYHPVGNYESTPIAPSLARYKLGKRKVLLDFENISPILKNQNNFSTELRKLNFFSSQFQVDSSTKNKSESDTTQEFGETFTIAASASSTFFDDDEDKENETSDSSALATSSDLFSCLQNTNKESQQPFKELCGNLDDILDKLQKLTATPPHDESFCRKDNIQLQQAASEVEELLTGLIKEIEDQKKSKVNNETMVVKETSLINM